MKNILYLFHHIHHFKNNHEVHHCGGEHKKSNYRIKHCDCKKHSINRQTAIGHDFNNKPIKVKFFEKCPKGGWHIESGQYQ
jgi:hypothetical protein